MHASIRQTRSWLLLIILAVAGAHAHEPVERPDVTAQPDRVPLHDDLGELTYPVTTGIELAQRYFDQGLRLAYAFHQAEALRSFRAAQQQDPRCAMCFWGEAWVLGPNINAAMDSTAIDPAGAAVRRAQALAEHPRERALIEALAQRYSGAPDVDKAAANRAYADAMAAVHRAYPRDVEIAVLYADALMNTSPWDYWEADGVTPKGQMGDAIDAIEAVLEEHPNHPGAIHYYIHLTEASRHPERAEPYADKLAALMPGAGHLVHMPSHVYFRVGRYRDSIETNRMAVQVDERTLARMDANDVYRDGLYPHNIHFVIASAQMAGDGATALEYALKLHGKISDAAAARVGWTQRIRAAPYLAYAQFGTPEAILGIPDPGGRFPYIKAMWHYARGVAFAQQADLEAARSEAARIAALRQSNDFEFLRNWGVPAPDVLRIARHVVEGRIAQAEGDRARAVREFQTAVTIQDSLPYMEPPHWYYPVRQSLGAALLAAGRPAEAVKELEISLARYPNNVYALFVLEQAQMAVGDMDGARATARRIEQSSIVPAGELALGQI